MVSTVQKTMVPTVQALMVSLVKTTVQIILVSTVQTVIVSPSAHCNCVPNQNCNNAHSQYFLFDFILYIPVEKNLSHVGTGLPGLNRIKCHAQGQNTVPQVTTPRS